MQLSTLLKFDRLLAGLGSFVCCLFFTGCAHVNNPWKDSSAVIDTEMTTASAEGYQGRTEFASAQRRPGESSTVRFENGAVSHWPLWFEDPFEDRGNRTTGVADRDAPDNEFKVTWVDYLHIGLGPARFATNFFLFPVSAVVTPPGTLMESDGRISKGLIWYQHDAARSDSATREPPDYNQINKSAGVGYDAEPIADDSGEMIVE